MRYFEKQALNPLGIGVKALTHLAGEGGGAWLSKFIASPTFKGLSKWFGSEGTMESLAASKNPYIQKLVSGGMKGPDGKALDLRKIMTESAGVERFTNDTSIPKSVRNAFNEAQNPKVTLKNAWNSPKGKIKGLADWAGNTFLGIGDNVGANLRKSLYDSRVHSTINPDMIYKGSRIGNLARNTFNKGLDAYFITDAFTGDLEPGQTRTGKALSNIGLIGGYRSSSKMLSGLARGTIYSNLGEKLGNNIGKKGKLPEPLEVEIDPISNQYRYI